MKRVYAGFLGVAAAAAVLLAHGSEREVPLPAYRFARLVSQRPAVEGALGALARVEWRELGSELEASLEELGLIRELRPPANARAMRPSCYLERKLDRWTVVSHSTPFGPLASKRRAQLAARALGDYDGDDLASVIPSLRTRLPRLARDLRFEDAARLRDRIAALEDVAGHIAELERLRRDQLCVLAPAREPTFWRAFFVSRGRVVRRTIPRGAAGRLEIEAGLAAAARAEPSLASEDAADLLAVASALRRPPPELRVVGLQTAEILAA
jgi:hypothetical protein